MEQRVRLEQLRLGRPPHTYAPLRSCIPDLLNQQGSLLQATVTPWENIDSLLVKESKSEKEYAFNRAVSKALYNYATSNGVISYSRSIANWAIGFGQHVCYWWKLYTVVSGQPCFPFIDPRLNNPLTSEARRFVFSVMHERIRVPDPDFSEANLLIMQFGKGDGGQRSIRLFDAKPVDLFDFDTLNAMVTKTYQIWIEVLEGREEARQTGTDGAGPLFSK